MTDIADTRRLLELTSSDGGGEVDQRTDDAIDEIVSLVDRRAPRLLDGQEVYAILLSLLSRCPQSRASSSRRWPSIRSP